MKIKLSQLRSIIREEVENISEARIPPVRLGNIYVNPRTREQISIEFISGDDVSYELLSRGRATSVDSSRADLMRKLAGGFVLDRNEQAY